MLSGIAKRIFGSANDRYIKSLTHLAEKINGLESSVAGLDDAALAARTIEFRQRLEKGETLDQLLPEAFATVREAAKRILGQRHYDVQLVGGMILHRGQIAEMKTGEGKTLVATLAVYLNALPGKGVHVVTVNDYLARRDADWMGQIYRFLGLTVGCITAGMNDVERKAAYECDVTYGTNNELGFDYLRDNMKFDLGQMVQRPFSYAIVDEVDSILIDEARTPLIISGPAEDSSSLYVAVDALIPHLEKPHYDIDEKARQVTLTEAGVERIEELLEQAELMRGSSLYDPQSINLLHHVTQALRAHKLFARDTDYIVRNDKVVIIDEFTGRMMEGRRYSEGLHQALEAKEKVTIQPENQTLASITFQNFFRLYPKLSGMTGTAMTEASEFADIYKLDVIEVPTHRAVTRLDQHDEVYRSAREKYDAIITLIEECASRQQPVLVGTVSIEKSEHLSALLHKRKIKHQVLNARYHEQEAGIIADAGMPGAVTIATNMAGRGTDIQLGGNFEMRVARETAQINDPDAKARTISDIKTDIEAKKKIALEAGGLFVIGTERHESRRIDNQLRGRSGRQGDPGASRFFLSLEDDLMRIFGMERMDGVLQKLGIKEGEAITHPWVNRALEKAQQKVEARNYEIRKNLLRYDDVMNDQRKVIYEQRRDIMRSADAQDTILQMRREVVDTLVSRSIPPKAYAEQWDVEQLHKDCLQYLNVDLPVADWAKEEGIAEDEIRSRIEQAIDRKMAEKAANTGPEVMRFVEKSVLLRTLDHHWKEHLLALDHLRHGIGLRAYAQRDPLNEYKREAFDLFQAMLDEVRSDVTARLAHVEIRTGAPETALPEPTAPRQMRAEHPDPRLALADADAPLVPAPAPASIAAAHQRGMTAAVQTVRYNAADDIDPNDPASWGKVARNAPCPCGSGKKYKHCHGKGE